MRKKRIWVALGVGLWSVLGQRAEPFARQSPPYELRLSAEEIDRLRRAWNDQLTYIPDEILVKFREGSTANERGRAIGAIGATAPASAGLDRIVRVVTPARADYDQALLDLRADASVEWAQPNYLRRLRSTPNDPGFTRQWNFDLIKMPRAWDIDAGGSDSIVVAVIDSGITTVTDSFPFSLWTGTSFESVSIPFRINPDLSSARLAEGRDFVFWNGPVVDMVGHGTHVAGTISQETNNELGFAGIAYRTKLMPLKACLGYWEIQLALSQRGIPGFVRPDETGACPDAALSNAIRYAADQGAAVVNLSLGGTTQSPIILDALTYAVSRGTFVAIAGGNEYEDGNPFVYPGRYGETIDGVITVEAIGRSGNRAYYSSTGSYIEVAAPGGDFRADGSGGIVYQASLFEGDFDPFRSLRPRFDRYVESGQQGTSMATPHVAGVAALLVSRGVSRPDEIERALKKFARDLGAPGRDDQFGHGLIDAPATLLGNGMGVAR